ncbi:MAG: hypothetical protein ACKE5M_08575, partial [Methylophilaceae bacterium]
FFSILAAVNADNTGALYPRNTAGLDDLVEENEKSKQFLALVDMGDGTEACANSTNNKSQNPNTSLMLNFGIKLPKGVKRNCI